MRPRRDGGLLLTLVGCLGLMAAMVGTVALVREGIPGRVQAASNVQGIQQTSPTPTGSAASTYGGIAQMPGAVERRHTLDPSTLKSPGPPATTTPAAKMAPALCSPTPEPAAASNPAGAGREGPAGDQPVTAGQRR
jgi:hypothetical protein